MRPLLFKTAVTAALCVVLSNGAAVLAQEAPAASPRSIGLLDAASAADDAWTLTHDISLISRWPTSSGAIREDKVTADLYRPKQDGRVPAAVIINSSGGVQP